jgi:hypothetical protein
VGVVVVVLLLLLRERREINYMYDLHLFCLIGAYSEL